MLSAEGQGAVRRRQLCPGAGLLGGHAAGNRDPPQGLKKNQPWAWRNGIQAAGGFCNSADVLLLAALGKVDAGHSGFFFYLEISSKEEEKVNLPFSFMFALQ